jgi:hypothetical protein
MSRDKRRGQAKTKKRTVKSSAAVKDLEPKKSLRAGASRRTTGEGNWKIAGNHNETVVRDQ